MPVHLLFLCEQLADVHFVLFDSKNEVRRWTANFANRSAIIQCADGVILR